MWKKLCPMPATKSIANVFCQAVSTALALILSGSVNASIANNATVSQKTVISKTAPGHMRTVLANSLRSAATDTSAAEARTHTAPAVQSFTGPASALAPGAPNYSGPNHNGPNHNGPSYNGPSYNGPSYNGPSYNGPSYNGPAYTGRGYAGPSHAGPNHMGPNHAGPMH